MVAISPAVHSSLDQASLGTQARIQLCESPADCVAFRLVIQPIPLVLVLAATSSGVDAILGLELCAQALYVDRFHITTDRVLHLNTISRVFESNPLHTVPILSHD